MAGVCPFKKTTLNLIYFELDNCRQLSSDLPKRVSHLLLLLLGDAFEMHKSALIKVALIDSRMKEATAPATPTSSTTTPSLKENFLTITSGGELIDISKNLNLWSIELFPPRRTKSEIGIIHILILTFVKSIWWFVFVIFCVPFLKLNKLFCKKTCGRSYKGSTTVNYDSRVVIWVISKSGPILYST